MQLSYSTLAVVLTTLAVSAPEVAAAPSANEGRTFSLCNLPNFGAPQGPWIHDSKPAAFCGKKPSNSGAWANIPAWDGGDSVKCGGWNTGLKICNGGNPKAPLPQSCNPPHSFPVGWNPKPAPSPPATTPPKCTWVTKCTPATCNWSQWWTCINPSSWSQKCTSTCVAPTPGTPSASSAAAGPSTAASSAAAAPSDAAPSDPASTVSSAAPAATSAAPVDPIQYPVCNQKYQVTYTNFTLIPTDGYWFGKRVGAATQDDSYMTYTLADSPESCLTACDNIEGCVFVNSYIDRNDDEAYLPKHTPGVYTCSMYSKCVGTEKNNNWGGQDDPNDIVNSSGYCKSGACGV